MAKFDVRDLIGKDLYASKNLAAHYGYPTSNDLVMFASGSWIGNVYSFMNYGSPSKTYVEFYTPGHKRAYFVENVDGNFDIDKLMGQGVQDVNKKAVDIEKDKEAGTWYQQLGSGVKKTVVTLGLAGIAVWGLNQYIKNRAKHTS